jgi:hypothetical protein
MFEPWVEVIIRSVARKPFESWLEVLIVRAAGKECLDGVTGMRDGTGFPLPKTPASVRIALFCQPASAVIE